jgi:hypothetical protein
LPLLVPEDKRSMSRVLLSPSVSVLRGLGIPPRVQAALDQIGARRERSYPQENLEPCKNMMHGDQARTEWKTPTNRKDSGEESIIIQEFPRLDGNRNSSVQPHHRQGLVYMYSTTYLGHIDIRQIPLTQARWLWCLVNRSMRIRIQAFSQQNFKIYN